MCTNNIMSNLSRLPTLLWVVLGWGRTSTRGTSSFDKLLEVSVPVVRAKTCQTGMSPLRITEDMICAGGLKGEDACSVCRVQRPTQSKRFTGGLGYALAYF